MVKKNLPTLDKESRFDSSVFFSFTL